MGPCPRVRGCFGVAAAGADGLLGRSHGEEHREKEKGRGGKMAAGTLTLQVTELH